MKIKSVPKNLLTVLVSLLLFTNSVRAESNKLTSSEDSKSAPASAEKSKCTDETVPVMVLSGGGLYVHLQVPVSYWGWRVPYQEGTKILTYDDPRGPPLGFSFPPRQNPQSSCPSQSYGHLDKIGGLSIVGSAVNGFPNALIQAVETKGTYIGIEGLFHKYCMPRGNEPCVSNAFISNPKALPWPIVATCYKNQNDGYSKLGGCTVFEAYSSHLLVILTLPHTLLLDDDMKNIDKDIGEFVHSLLPDPDDPDNNKIGHHQ